MSTLTDTSTAYTITSTDCKSAAQLKMWGPVVPSPTLEEQCCTECWY